MNNKRIYIAGPLFSHAERAFNEKLNDFLRENGYLTFLPQKDGYVLSELLRNSDPREASAQVFRYDLEQIQESDILVLVMDGRVPDEGACIEAGIAYASGKECYGLKTDTRSLMNSQDNPMILGVLRNRIANSFEVLVTMIRRDPF